MSFPLVCIEASACWMLVNERLRVEEKRLGTHTLGSEPSCVHMSSYDPPVNLETVLIIRRWKLRGVWFRSLARGQCSSIQACVRTVLMFQATSCPLRF